MITIWDCSVEGCNRPAESGGTFCATHAREARKKTAPKAKPARKRIAKQSEEGKERAELYRAIRALFMAVNTRCLAHNHCFPGSARPEATEVHHRKGRDGNNLFDVRWFLPVCRACHERITIESEWAYNEGLSLSRHQTETI